MITRGIRSYVNRDWRAARGKKDACWRDRIARLGAAEALRIADELRREMRLLRPDWPDQAQRRDDLLSHARLAERLRRAGSPPRLICWLPWRLSSRGGVGGASSALRRSSFTACRLSADVDVTLDLTPDAPEQFAADMQAAGFTLRADDPEFVQRTRVMPFVHEATGMPSRAGS